MRAFPNRDFVAARSSTLRGCLTLSGCVMSLRCRRRVYTEGQLRQLLERLDQAIEGLEAQNHGGEGKLPARLREQFYGPESVKATGQTGNGGVVKP